MRAVIITCLLATAVAAPQGYNYQQQAGNFPLPGIPQIGASSSSASGSHVNTLQEGQSFLQQTLQLPKVQHTLLGGAGGIGFSSAPQLYQAPKQTNFGSNALPHSFGLQQQSYQQGSYTRPLAPVVTKDIYVHVAPEEPEEQYVQPQLPVAPPRKHYRIVFIKAPAPSLSKAALRVKQAPNEEKTIIYVLTKKPDPLELQAAFEEAAPKPPSKPEVYFIKYKTQEEAQHAQRTIQAQYDQLGGTTQFSDEGVAPVTSVIGSLDQTKHTAGGITGFGGSGSGSGIGIGIGSSSSGGGGFTSSSSSSAGSGYLPPIVRHK